MSMFRIPTLAACTLALATFAAAPSFAQQTVSPPAAPVPGTVPVTSQPHADDHHHYGRSGVVDFDQEATERAAQAAETG